MSGLEALAERNLAERFVDNPCRGIVLARDEAGEFVQLSWIMGRSAGSKNRIYVAEGNHVLRTALADPSHGGGNALTLYAAMDSVDGAAFVVGNGDQVDTI